MVMLEHLLFSTYLYIRIFTIYSIVNMIKDYRFSVKIKSESKWNLHFHLTCAKLLNQTGVFLLTKYD